MLESMEDARRQPPESDFDREPIVAEWRRIYIGVLCYLACLIAALYVMSQAFSY